MVLALYALVSACIGISQPTPPPSPAILIVLADGSQLTGTVLSQNPNQVMISTNSFHAVGAPPISVLLDASSIASCSMVNQGASSVTIAGHLCAGAVSLIHSGFQSATLSVGYIGSAQRDESAKGTITVAGYQGLTTAENFRGKTYFFLNGSYDDKWKATRFSSNVTQTYEGLLTQSIFSKPTPAVKCSSDDYPFAYLLTGHAYHNNSQGIQVDQSYSFGLSKYFVLGNAAGPVTPGCSRAANPYSQRVQLSADLRSVNYILYPPGSSVHGVGTQLQIGYSRALPTKTMQYVAMTIGGVPVFNNANMSQASGVFLYELSFNPSWAVQFSAADNYYEIAPKTFNKNYVNLSLGIKFTPSKTVAPK
ncbi:MAG: hypothetical protein ABR906_01760 [Terracidiphilus sp.]|jgi:hypothetical protein